MRELIFQEIRNKKMSVNDAWAPTIVMQFYNKHCKNMDYSSRIHGYHNPAGDGTSNRPAFYVHILQSFYPKNPFDCQHSGRLLPAYFR